MTRCLILPLTKLKNCLKTKNPLLDDSCASYLNYRIQQEEYSARTTAQDWSQTGLLRVVSLWLVLLYLHRQRGAFFPSLYLCSHQGYTLSPLFCYLSSLFSKCIQNDLTSQHGSLSTGFKKPRPIQLSIKQNQTFGHEAKVTSVFLCFDPSLE